LVVVAMPWGYPRPHAFNASLRREPATRTFSAAVADWHDAAMRLIDLSHTVSHGLVTYPGLPAPVISDHLTFEASHEVYAEGTEFAIARIEMIANTGTYLDTPGHRLRGGHDLSALPLEKCALLPALVVAGEDTGPTGLAAFEGLDVAGHAVLVHTGWDLHFGTETYGAPEHPYLATEAAEWLADPGAALVGIDSVNIDATPPRGERPVHTLLLEREIPVVEHLTGLSALPPTGATFSAVPVKVAGMATFPVRAFASLPD
jgi:kynurenine formamidase